jgi:integrase
VLTGERQGELLVLRWGDLDLERRVLLIRRTYSPQHGFNEPKSERGRRAVKVTPVLAEILREHKEKTGGKAVDLMFTNRAGNPIDGTNLLAQEFHPTLERAGLRRVRFHDLRHTYAALQIALDENEVHAVPALIDRLQHHHAAVLVAVSERLRSDPAAPSTLGG